MLGALGFDPVGLLVLGGVGAVLPWLLDGLRRKRPAIRRTTRE